ncbi:MAG: hypothetical protein ACI9S8_002382 [Chlamydiales bacterium]|jgi:hypothetical protein
MASREFPNLSGTLADREDFQKELRNLPKLSGKAHLRKIITDKILPGIRREAISKIGFDSIRNLGLEAIEELTNIWEKALKAKRAPSDGRYKRLTSTMP